MHPFKKQINMKKIIFLIVALAATYFVDAKDGNGNSVKASLNAVTVYRQGAEMNHQAKAQLGNGNNELVIENISNALDPNSIQVNCDGNVTVMGIEFSTDYLKEEVKSPALRLLEDSVERISREMDKTRSSINIVNDLISVLKANKEIKGTQTGLSVAELMKLMEYFKTKSGELQNDLAAFNQQQIKQDKQLKKLTEQIAEEQKKNTRSAGKLILQLNCAIAGKYDFNISYVTQNAYWAPFYDLRAASITAPLKIVYRAKIFQTTGIDWQQVKLSLSTSTPSQTGNAPLFNSWFLSYINPVNYYNNTLALQNSIPGLSGKAAGVALNEVVVVGYGAASNFDDSDKRREEAEPVYIVNGNEMSATEFRKIRPGAIKTKQVLKDAAATNIYGSRASHGAILVTLKDGLDDYITVSDKELNVTFDIDLPYDVPTNGKAQTAVLKEYQVPATYQFYAVPKLDKEVFLLAQIADWEKLNLLPGEANIIFEGTYIGKSFIDPSSTQDTLNLTIGRDKRVVVKREKLMDFSSVKFLGANKKQIFTYEITVKNNKKEAISMLLKDQYPLSQNKEIEVELLQSDGASINAETGVLNWKLQLAPNESKKVRISYSVKYPKDKVLNL
jgi:TonB-dependent SusC/RagA subfamily outer membrane receptor